jgi:transcriptional regulator with GAF, ATPase, and Fis domain
MTAMSDSTFFKNATLRICGSLNIGRALSDLFEYLSGFVSLQRIQIDRYDTGEKVMSTVARVENDGGVFMGERMVFSDTMAREFEALVEAHGNKRFSLVDTTSLLPEIRAVLMRHSPQPLSVLAVMLNLDNTSLGVLIYQSGEKNAFSPDLVNMLQEISEPVAMALSNALQFEELSRIKNRLDEDNLFLRNELSRVSGEYVVGEGAGLRATMQQISRVAVQDTPMLILGETGVGKEILARSAHAISPRRDNPFVAVNCGAISPGLLDSELFGHAKGAFTGATTEHKGRFERAGGGTLFLDEIGELPPEAQVRLLRVIQEKEIERVGGNSPVSVDVRIIAATHRDLEAMVRQGAFREDLFFRLGVVPITVPPLRERAGDIPLLVNFFVEKISKRMGFPVPRVTTGGMKRLCDYDWPGNVRELQNVVERGILLTEGQTLDFFDLGRHAPVRRFGRTPDDRFDTLEEVEREHIKLALARSGGKVEGRDGAAAILGINPSTLRHRMRKQNIPFGRMEKR